MKKSLLITGIIVLAVGGILIALQLGNKEAEAPSSTTETNQTNSTDTSNNQEDTAPEQLDAQIIYTDNGFSPNTYSVASGARVGVTNNSSRTLDFASDEHPTHTDNSELNIGNIQPSQSKTMTLGDKGVWGFHNHDFDAHSGTITVE